MSQPFTEDDLAGQLTQDLTWRVREISDLKSAIRSADRVAQPAILRATLAICYAHWEGHVRFSARRYLQHIALRKLTFAQLAPQFLRNDFLPRLAAVPQKSMQQRGELVDAIQAGATNRFVRVNEDLVSTRSNLNSDVLYDICTVCGVDPAPFASSATFIDVILLKRRNAIAHGEDTLIAVAELDDFTEGTIGLMRQFSNELQAKAYLGGYRAA